LIIRRWHSSLLDVRSSRAADCDTDHYLVVAEVRERLAVSKQTTSFSLKKLNEAEGREQYRIKVPNRFAALKNFEAEMDIIRT
jgi:hypothetical protein